MEKRQGKKYNRKEKEVGKRKTGKSVRMRTGGNKKTTKKKTRKR